MAGREAPEVTLAAKSVCHRRHADVKEAMRKEVIVHTRYARAQIAF